MNRPLLFGLALAAQLAVLGGLVVREERTLRTGRRVVLEVSPADPMDFLKGRYLALQLAVGSLDSTLVPLVGFEASPGNTVFLRLRRAEPFWLPEFLYDSAPDGTFVGSAFVFLRGRIASVSGKSYRVQYGLERFYMPESAEDPSLAMSRDSKRRVKLALVVRVRANGESATEDLLVDGVPFAQWSRAEKARSESKR